MKKLNLFSRNKRESDNDDDASQRDVGKRMKLGHDAEKLAQAKPDSWAIESIVDNLTYAAGRVTAWYVAAPQNWSFRSVSEGENLIHDQAIALSELIGTTIHCRVTFRPYPVQKWAKVCWENAADPQPGFAEMMERDQLHMATRAQADKLVFYGIDLGQRGIAMKALGKVVSGALDREAQALQERIGFVSAVMGSGGFEAHPATSSELEWLLARSLALGCPVPVPDVDEPKQSEIDQSDLEGYMSQVSWTALPLAATTQITTSMNDVQATRHVVVLTLGRVGELEIPEKSLPWAAMTDQLPFPVEWSMRVVPRQAEDVQKDMTSVTNKIDGQLDHWQNDHNKRPPKQLARQAHRAAEVDDEQRREFSGLSTRTRGWYRLAIAGETEKQALDRARQVADLFKPQIRVARDLGQYHLAREFVPGEPLASKAHARKFPILKVAAAVPMVAAEVGDKRGFHIGETTGAGSRAVTFDPWYMMEVMERGGLCPVVGTPGSGKSTLLGLLIWKSILSGVRGVAMDPAGRLQQLCRLPEIAPLARSVDLLGGHPGSLSPYAVVPDPNRKLIALESDTEEDFHDRLRQAEAAARSTRQDLTFLVLRYCLSYQLGQQDEAQNLLREAIGLCESRRTSSAGDVLAQLRMKKTELALRVVRELETARDRELGRLFFSPEVRTRDDIDRSNGKAPVPFTFFNLKGLVIPDATASSPDEWMPEELLARPIMTLAAWSALSLVQRGDPNDRKLFALDEAHEITSGSGVGRSLAYKLSTDSRKNNCAALMSTQNASGILGQRINNFVGSAFVGRTSDEEAQRDAVKLLGKPEGIGYEELLGKLSPQRKSAEGQKLGYRDFVYRDGLGGDDGLGGMEKIRVTLDHHPELKRVLDTTPDQEKRTSRGGVPEWAAGMDLDSVDVG